MIIKKTDTGFQCVLTAEYLEDKGVNMQNIYEVTPANPIYMQIIQEAMQNAIQKAYIQPGVLGMIEIDQSVELENNRIILNFTNKGDIVADELENLTNMDKQEFYQELRENEDLNPYNHPETEIDNHVEKLKDVLSDIYYKNHPDEKIKKVKDSGESMLITARTKNLTNMITLCTRLPETNRITSTIYKYKDAYYLLMDVPAEVVQTNDKILFGIALAIAESNAAYDNKNPYFKALLDEHGTIIVKNNAIAILTKI